MIEDTEGRRAAELVGQVDSTGGDHHRRGSVEVGDDRLGSLLHEGPRGGDREPLPRHPQDLSSWSVLARDHEDRAVGPELGLYNAVFVARQLHPGAVLSAEVMLEAAAVAILHGGQHATRGVGLRADLGHPGEALSQLDPVPVGRGSELVEPELLVEVEVFLRTLPGAGVTGVEEARPVGRPGQVAPGGAAVDPGDDLVDPLSGLHVDDMDVAALRSTAGERDGDPLAVGRRHVPVDGGAALGVDLVRVQHHGRLVRTLGRGEHDQKRLLLRRLVLDGEQPAATPREPPVGVGLGFQDPRHALPDRVPRRQSVQHGPGPIVLCVTPLPDLGVVPILEPAVVFGDRDPVIGLRHRGPGGLRWAGLRACRQGQCQGHEKGDGELAHRETSGRVE